MTKWTLPGHTFHMRPCFASPTHHSVLVSCLFPSLEHYTHLAVPYENAAGDGWLVFWLQHEKDPKASPRAVLSISLLTVQFARSQVRQHQPSMARYEQPDSMSSEFVELLDVSDCLLTPEDEKRLLPMFINCKLGNSSGNVESPGTTTPAKPARKRTYELRKVYNDMMN